MAAYVTTSQAADNLNTTNGNNIEQTVNIGLGVIYVHVLIGMLAYAVCFITNIIGNTLTLVAVYQFSWLPEQAYCTLLALTIADLLVSLNIIILYDTCKRFVQLGYIYILLSGIQDFVKVNAVLHVVLVAINRFIAILWP